MSNHIQIRDLIEQLQRHDPTAGIVVSMGDESLTILDVGRENARTRNIAINIDGDSVKVQKLEKHIEELEADIEARDGLLNDFCEMMGANDEPFCQHSKLIGLRGEIDKLTKVA